MATDVDLSDLDFPAVQARMATEQRKLLRLATQNPEGGRRPGPDGAAAAKLLLYFSREMIVDADVREAIMDGVREVAAFVVNETLLRKDGQPVNVNPLMFFLGVDSPYREGRKNKKNERLALAAAFGDPTVGGALSNAPLMTIQEARHALTTKWTVNDAKDGQFGGEKRKRKDWKKKVKVVESILVEYVSAKHSASNKAACRSYVHASFPAIRWHEDAEEELIYPATWE